MSLDNFSLAQLALLPRTSLIALQNVANTRISEAVAKLKPLNRRISKLTGVGRLERGGSAGVTSVAGNSSAAKATGTSKSFGAPIRAVSDVYNEQVQRSNPPITNLSPDPQDVTDLIVNINAITQTVDTDEALNHKENQSREVATLRAKTASHRLEKQAAKSLIIKINQVLEDRLEDPTLEPIINFDDLDTEGSDKARDFITRNIVTPYIQNLSKYEKFLYGVSTEDLDSDSMFDLVYGPPISVKGQFVLSEDGLYYDSRVGGIDPSAVLPMPEGDVDPNSSWMLNFPPNLGGKGQLYTDVNFSGLTNTVFDMDWYPDDDVTDNFNISQYYDTDDVIETFEANKALQVHIVSGHISELMASGYTANSAMVLNYYTQITAVANTYDSKLRKRKKQLDLVAIFANDLYSFTNSLADDPKNLGIGDGHLIIYKEGTYWAPINRIPVNDFSFMRGKGVYVDLDLQQELVIFSEDLDDTILPIVPKFLVTPIMPLSVLDKFAIADPATSEWVTTEEIDSVSGSGRIVHNLVDRITTSGLILGYNFLKPNAVHASSNEFNLDNFAPDSGFALDAQIVASSTNYLFPSGVAIPYFEGTYYNYKGNGAAQNSAVPGGSYVRLPSTHRPDESRWLQGRDLEDLTYLDNIETDSKATLFDLGGGFSFDCWVHVPSISAITDDHRYRLILANENTGRGHEENQTGADQFVDNARLQESSVGVYQPNADLDKTHGLIFGFRDAGGSSNASGIELILAPTVSQNKTGGSYHSACIASTFSATEKISFQGANDKIVPSASSITDLGMYIPSSIITPEGVSWADTSDTFIHLGVIFNYITDEVKIFVDGSEVGVSSFSRDFCGGSKPGDVQGMFIPNDVMHSDSNYTNNESWEPATLQGPKTGAVNLPDITANLGFTPWILGGGYTDSSPSGFLGKNTNDVFETTSHIAGQPSSRRNSQHIGDWAVSHRARSGLSGHIGSFKMYARPLTNSEVLQNFDAQKGFFKNILT